MFSVWLGVFYSLCTMRFSPNPSHNFPVPIYMNLCESETSLLLSRGAVAFMRWCLGGSVWASMFISILLWTSPACVHYAFYISKTSCTVNSTPSLATVAHAWRYLTQHNNQQTDGVHFSIIASDLGVFMHLCAEDVSCLKHARGQRPQRKQLLFSVSETTW